MAEDKWEILFEADRRGLLDEEKSAALKEAVNRGILPYRVQQSYLRTERARLVQRAREIGMDPRDLFVPEERASFGVGLDKGLEDVALGMTQLGTRLVPGEGPVQTRVDEAISSRSPVTGGAGVAGEITGNVVGSMLPGGAAVKGVQRVAPAAGPVIEAIAGGAAEGAAQPADPDNFAGEKAGQVAAGAGVGGGVAGAVRGATRVAEGVANAPRVAENLPGQLANRQIRRGTPEAVEGRRLADEYEVGLTPGQESGSPTLQFLEQRARESWLSREAAAQGDLERANQLLGAIERQAGDVDSEKFALGLQRAIRTSTRRLARDRSETGRQLYGEVDRVAGGAKVVEPQNLRAELQAIVDEAGTIETGDWPRVARQAQQMIDVIDGQGGYSASEALKRLQAWSPYSKGDLFDEVNPGLNATLKRRVYGAILSDMDATAAQGDNVGEMVRRANKTWREYSQKIDDVERSALGKMVGDEFASDLLNASDTVPAEKVMDQLMRLKPTQARYVAEWMGEYAPEQSAGIRGAILRDAIEASMEAPPSGGAAAEFNPGGFLRALGLTGNKRGAEARQRLMYYFGGKDSEGWKTVSDLIDLSRRLADTTGKNFSGTAAANQFFEVIRRGVRSGGEFLGASTGTVLEAMGLQRITRSMNPNDPLFRNLQPRPLLQAPRVVKGSALPAGLGSASGAQARDDDE